MIRCRSVASLQRKHVMSRYLELMSQCALYHMRPHAVYTLAYSLGSSGARARAGSKPALLAPSPRASRL